MVNLRGFGMAERLILTEWTKIMIKEHWKPCGLDRLVEQQLEDLYWEEMRVGRKWMPQRLEYSVKKATNQAKGLAKKYDKDVCHYLTMALKNRWIETWYRVMGF